MPQISVIIPTYNCARYITEAIESVFGQTYKDFEIIIIDDGSTDNTKDVLQKYIGKGTITYIYQENHGPSAARNRGIRIATGTFIALLDADDLWLPDKLEKQVDYFEKNPEVALLHANTLVQKDNEIINEGFPIRERHRGFSVFEELYLRNFINTSTVIFRRDRLRVTGLFDETFTQGEDYDLWLRFAANFPVGYLDEVTSVYRLHESSAATDVTKMDASVLQVLDKIKSLYPEQVARISGEKIKQRLYKLNYYVGYGYFCQYRLAESRRYFLRALKYRRSAVPLYLYVLSTYLNRHMIDVIRDIKRKALSLQEKKSLI